MRMGRITEIYCRQLVPHFGLVIATLLLVVAAGSLIVDTLVVGEVWHLRQSLDNQLITSIQLAQDTLATSDDTLVVLDNQIQTVSAVASTAGSAGHTTIQVIDATDRSLQSALHLLRTEMPATLDEVHAAVVSAQSAAALVDTTLAELPFIPGLSAPYNPPVPLHVSLGDLAQSIERLPALTTTLADDLAGADAALPETRRNVTSVTQTLEQNPIAAAQLHNSISQYREQLSRLKRELSDLRVIADQWLTWISIAVTFFVGWIAVIHAAILLVGVRWLRHDRLRPRRWRAVSPRID
jgi:uncharacterized phage infection (PIP) family protein YhgE